MAEVQSVLKVFYWLRSMIEVQFVLWGTEGADTVRGRSNSCLGVSFTWHRTPYNCSLAVCLSISYPPPYPPPPHTYKYLLSVPLPSLTFSFLIRVVFLFLIIVIIDNGILFFIVIIIFNILAFFVIIFDVFIYISIVMISALNYAPTWWLSVNVSKVVVVVAYWTVSWLSQSENCRCFL